MTMETQLDAIQQKLDDNLSLFVPKRGRAYCKGESNIRKEVCILIGGLFAQEEEADTYTQTILDRLTYAWLV